MYAQFSLLSPKAKLERLPAACLSLQHYAHSCSLWETSMGPYPEHVKCDDPRDECTTCTGTWDGAVFDYLFHIETDPLETVR